MDFWFETEIRVRRDDVLASVLHRQRIREVESGRRSTGLRAHVADSAQTLSDCLANVADRLRDTTRA